MSSFVAGAAGLIGAAIGATAAIGAQFIAHRFARARDRTTHLRTAYADYGEAAYHYIDVSMRLMLIIKDWQDSRGAYRSDADKLREATEDFNRRRGEAFALRESTLARLHGARCRVLLLERNNSFIQSFVAIHDIVMQKRLDKDKVALQWGREPETVATEILKKIDEWLEEMARRSDW